MAVTPFRDRIKRISPAFLRDGVGERLMYVFGVLLDALLEKATQAIAARLPNRAQADALAVLALDRVITPGPLEPPAALGQRLKRAFDAWQLAGSDRGVLGQVLGYMTPFAPVARIVATRWTLDPVRIPTLLQWSLGVQITGATTASPIVITTATAHGFSVGQNVTVTGVGGNTAANGAFNVAASPAPTATTFALSGSTGSGAYTLGGRVIATSSIPAPTYPPTRVSSTWSSYPLGRSSTAEPVFVLGTAGSTGDWNWDGSSRVLGTYGWWGCWLILYAVAPNAFVSPAPAWGAGSSYGASGYYSTVSGGAYTLAGVYTGSTAAWGTGSTYAGSGYYSTVSGGAYAPSGIYSGGVGVTPAWGVLGGNGSLFGSGLRAILGNFKGAHAWFRGIIVSFDLTLFDPAQTADGVHNPAGTFGQWSSISGGAYIETRFTSAVYGEGVA